MVAALCLFLALSRCRRRRLVLRWPNCWSEWTERGISKEGEPSRPTPSRTGPLTGIMTLVASRQSSPVRPPAG